MKAFRVMVKKADGPVTTHLLKFTAAHLATKADIHKTILMVSTINQYDKIVPVAFARASFMAPIT